MPPGALPSVPLFSLGTFRIHDENPLPFPNTRERTVASGESAPTLVKILSLPPSLPHLAAPKQFNRWATPSQGYNGCARCPAAGSCVLPRHWPFDPSCMSHIGVSDGQLEARRKCAHPAVLSRERRHPRRPSSSGATDGGERRQCFGGCRSRSSGILPSRSRVHLCAAPCAVYVALLGAFGWSQ